MNKQHLIDTAKRLVKRDGLINLSRTSLCKAAGVPEGSFTGIMDCSFTDFVNELKSLELSSNSNPDIVRYRTDPQLRAQHILEVAVNVAKIEGYACMTREQVAEAAGVSMGLVSRYFNTMTQLRRDVVRYAIKNEVTEVLLQALVNRDKHVKKIPTELKEKIAQTIK